MSKRIVFRTASVGAVLMLVLCAGPAAAVAVVLPGPGSGEYVRKEFHSLTPEEVEAYAAGVELMKSREFIDPTSWLYQANIHGVPGGTTCGTATPGSYPAWNTCQHGTYFFLSWHRMYLYFFERILRSAVQEAIGDPDYPFALPYWNYQVHPLLPEPFRVPNNAAANPLWTPRSAWCNQGLTCVPPPASSSEVALALLHFCNCPGTSSCAGCQRYLDPLLTFGSEYSAFPQHLWNGHGQLETQPHDIVHVVIGGWMSRVDCSARDPIFYLHHANIDRLWQVWLNLGLGRANPLGADSWKNQEFTFFDETGEAVVLTGCQVVDMAGQLGYVYDGVPVENVQHCDEPIFTPDQSAQQKELLAASGDVQVELGAEPVTVIVPLSNDLDRQILETAQTDSGRILLNVDDVTLVNPGGAYSIYINLMPWEEPDPSSSHFAGNLGIFGNPNHAHEQDRSYDVTDHVVALSQKGRWTDSLEVTFVRLDPEEAEDPEVFLRVDQVSVVKQ